MARLLSVNVGLPRDIEWKGRIVHTGIWKSPLSGRCRVGRLNVEGDGQGDLAGHGGEQRAVFVYQIESCRYWKDQLKRPGYSEQNFGQFGENFTIEGLPDDTVCIGDRYRIGSALFEVTQPRVTCYRVGIRLDEPRMPALLTASGRPGFYFRVLEEGEVEAGDEIVKAGEAKERMTITQINALLYSANHPRDLLERALTIDALSRGWRESFEAMLRSSTTGNAGLMPQAASYPAAPGFHRLAVTAIERESADVLSVTMRNADGQPLPAARAGQYVVLRLQPTAGAAIFRSYSLSGALSGESCRISVKIEPNGAAGTWLRDHVRVGDTLDISSPRGSFVLQDSGRPVLLLSAGIGATPVLAMLHALAETRSTRQVLWLHAARDREHHSFAAEVRGLLASLPNARGYVCYSSPAPLDRPGEDFDAKGRLSLSVFPQAGVSRDADVYLCGPPAFMADMKAALAAYGVSPASIHIETFNGGETMSPGVVRAAKRDPHVPEGDGNTGPLISFARSGIAAHWNAALYQSLLELAEACDVPVRWSCRAGVCHSCESGLVSGAVTYAPEPLDQPAEGNILVCCSQPLRDSVIDL
ncbi:MAG TPA: MOSC and FAD-binding oxidoreductase domain-containing protein [Bryobacteraceae bacterium]|nr:MOSC and FAD-binding oxidoreductase domain-containing protein [Bryobacteraceae bacterium]